MSDTPDDNICKLSADLGWAADTLHNVDKRLIQMSKEAKKLQQERDEAREALDNETQFHHRTHGELVKTQCALMDARAALQRITECDMRWSKKIARDTLGAIK